MGIASEIEAVVCHCGRIVGEFPELTPAEFLECFRWRESYHHTFSRGGVDGVADKDGRGEVVAAEALPPLHLAGCKVETGSYPSVRYYEEQFTFRNGSGYVRNVFPERVCHGGFTLSAFRWDHGGETTGTPARSAAGEKSALCGVGGGYTAKIEGLGSSFPEDFA